MSAAIEILDTEGEGALTFRALAARLATGSGAIYWHVAGKTDLLAAATDEIISGAVGGAGSAAVRDTTARAGNGGRNAGPRDAIRAIALGVFDAIDAHPWVGTQLSGEPWQPAMLPVFEHIGRELQPLGVPEQAQFDAVSALVNYILGLASQYAAAARLVSPETDRSAFLATVTARWLDGDPAAYPFVRQIAAQLSDHDDREQFLAGIDLILAGITSLR